MKKDCINCTKPFDSDRPEEIQVCPACKASWPDDPIILDVCEAFMNHPDVRASVREKEQGK